VSVETTSAVVSSTSTTSLRTGPGRLGRLDGLLVDLDLLATRTCFWSWNLLGGQRDLDRAALEGGLPGLGVAVDGARVTRPAPR
jgi:hypothetical protein